MKTERCDNDARYPLTCGVNGASLPARGPSRFTSARSYLRRRCAQLLAVLAACLIVLSCFAPSIHPAPQTSWSEWLNQSFEDFAKGTLGAGGANLYISAKGRLQWINHWDLNQDGYVDLFFGQTHDTNYAEPVWVYYQGEISPVSLPSLGGYRLAVADLNRDRRPDLVVGNSDNNISSKNYSFVYWGSASGFQRERRLQLWSEGVSGIAVADLNSDGFPDLVFANNAGGSSFIYWGGPEGLSDSDRTDLPTYQATGVAVADLNRDGQPDIVFANGSEQGGGSFVYWGDRQQFAKLQRTVLPTQGAMDVAASDLDGDEFPEVVFAEWRGADGRAGIYWGGADGYSAVRRHSVPAPGIYGVTVADVNADAYPELVLPCGISGEHSYGLREYRRNAGEVGRPPSLLYWGSKNGYSKERRTELPSQAATSASIADYNGDGRPDVVITQLQDGEQFETDSLLFFGRDGGFDVTRPVRFRTRGATDSVMADLNGDGKLDLAFANKISGNAKGTIPSYVYWGGREGYSGMNRLELPSSGSNEAKFADFNDDGWVDVFVCNQDHDDRTLNTGSSIFWGGPKGISVSDRTRIDDYSCFGASVADLDKDGRLDIVISTWDEANDSVFVYWGSQGYSRENRTTLPQRDGRQTLIADLNNDGYLDIAAASYLGSDGKIFWGGPRGYSGERFQSLPGLGTVGIETADLNSDGFPDVVLCNFGAPGSEAAAPSYIYWGTAAGFSEKRRTELPTMLAHDASIADINGDGYLDIVFSNYRSRQSRMAPAFIYWGGSNGFDGRHRSLLPARGAAGLQVADLNRDGILDFVFANHVSDQGDHRTNSMILWGSPGRYQGAGKVTWLPTLGPHNMLSVDVGNRLTRQLEEEYISSSHRAHSSVNEVQLAWEGEAPRGARLLFQIRSAATQQALDTAPWQGPAGKQSYFESPGQTLRLSGGHSWLQYRVVLTSPDGASNPVLDKVTLRYR